MTASWLLLSAQLRRHWRGVVMVAVLLGVGLGITLATAAGARRTASAHDALLRESGLAQGGVTTGPVDYNELLAAADRVDEIDELSVTLGFTGFATSVPPESLLFFLAQTHPRGSVDRMLVLDGREPATVDEVAISETAAERSGLRVGDSVSVMVFDRTFQRPKPVEVTVVGVAMSPDEVITDVTAARPYMIFSEAFAKANTDRTFWSDVSFTVNDGTDPAAVAAALAAAARGNPEATESEDRARIQNAIRPMLAALIAFTALAAGSTLVVGLQAVSRLTRRSEASRQSFRALGVTPRELRLANALTAATVAVGATAIALVIAVLSAPLMPLGRLRIVNDVVGVSYDLTALIGGSLAFAAILIGVPLLLGGRRGSSGDRLTRVGTVPSVLRRDPTAAVGASFATGQRGVARTVVGIAAGLAAVVAAVTFTGSLDRLIEDEELSGFSWDVVGRDSYGFIDVDEAVAAADLAKLERLSSVTPIVGQVDGVPIGIAAFEEIKGNPFPPVTSGRVPQAADEVLVGETTLAQLGLSIGDEVVVAAESFAADAAAERRSGKVSFTVVGSAVAPAITVAGTQAPRLDSGFIVSAAGRDRLVGPVPGPDMLFFDMAPGTTAADVQRWYPEGLPDMIGVPTEWFDTTQPSEITQAAQSEALIWWAIVALAAAVVATVAYVLVGFVRQRRSSYAVLKTLGFTRGQITRTVLWQSGLVAIIAVLLALPVGIAAGRWLWTAFAERIGVLVTPTVPVLLLAATAAGALAIIEGAASVPAALARRTPPADGLRAE